MAECNGGGEPQGSRAEEACPGRQQRHGCGSTTGADPGGPAWVSPYEPAVSSPRWAECGSTAPYGCLYSHVFCGAGINRCEACSPVVRARDGPWAVRTLALRCAPLSGTDALRL